MDTRTNKQIQDAQKRQQINTWWKSRPSKGQKTKSQKESQVSKIHQEATKNSDMVKCPSKQKVSNGTSQSNTNQKRRQTTHINNLFHSFLITILF